MKVGLIGFGSAGRRHYDNLQEFTSDIIVLSKRRSIKVSHKVHSWSSFKKLGPFDVIFITNETCKHLKTVKQCMKLKPRAIFVEKPLSHSSRGLVELQKIVTRDKINLWVGYNRHFYRPLMQIRKYIAEHKIGKIYYLRIFIGQNLREWRQRDYRLSYSSKKEQGGGVVLDLIHEINYAGWLLGEELAFKNGIVRKLSDLEINTEDCADSLLISKSGTVVSVHQDYLCVPLRWSVEAVGSKGTIYWDRRERKITIQYADKTELEWVPTEYNEMFKDELKSFFNLLLDNKFFTNIEEAVKDIVVVEKIKKYGKK